MQPGYLTILSRLWERDGITQKELKATLDIEQATLSNTLKRMERDGLVEQKRTKEDRRRHHITLTDHGRSIQSTVTAAIDDLRSSVNQGLTINDRRYFKRIMRQMTEKLEEDQMESIVVLLDEVVD
ncbi:MarR family transcriptional regulator [Pseudodesulfovibrio sp. zrk46]|uniref:MarR family winged helix-turn-helix transcriptional regulator n=1 Tax=Pseudodesulfovibrio sp. zrk46 TaxID=2725288 RepID=UPI001FFC518F|nr:MarR family transcriptional regulator [Pseudodesulfovibrio sp. zrk46]